MNLREKTLVVLGITFICAFILILALSLTFYLGSASDLERGQAGRDVQRVLHAIDNDLSGLDAELADWGWWDDTYAFSQNLNEDYITANLAETTLQNIELNYFIIVSPNGTVLYAKGHDLRSGQDMPVPAGLLSDISNPSLPLLSLQGKERKTGILVGRNAPVFIGSVQILKSNEEGPGTGFLVFAREVDDLELARLSGVTGEFIFVDIPAGNGESSTPVFISRPFRASSVSIDQKDPSRLTGTATLADNEGRPALFIGIRNSRETYQTALVIIRNYLIIITITMAFFAGIVILLMDKMVLNRLSLLVDRVRERGTMSGRENLSAMTGNDEFVRLDEVITESEQKIRESEARYRRIIETAQEGIFILDPEQRITFANDRMAGMLGISPEDLAGRSLKEFIPAEEMADFMKRTAARKAGISERYERRLIGKDGRILWTLVSSTPVFSGPDYAGSFTMVTDITDRKRAELALNLATKKLSTLNIITFNDLQSQLFTLQGYTELAEANATEGKVKGYISRQRDVANRIRQQISFAHMIQKMGARPPSWQNVNRAFLFAISHLDLSSVSRVIELDGLEIYVDSLFETVLYSLVDNSLRHGKTVTAIGMSYHDDEEGLVLLYEDDGTGIAPDMKESIFEQRYSSGSGVSLFLAREILSLTGITIRETGTYTKGARFEIHIPRGGFRYSGNGGKDGI